MKQLQQAYMEERGEPARRKRRGHKHRNRVEHHPGKHRMARREK